MSHPLPRPWTVDDFLAWERRQPERYEFVGGVIRMMVGGSNTHTIIKDNILGALRARLRGQPCRALGEGPKVVTATATMYPDAIVVCGPIDLAEDQVRAPTLVVEVLSRSTEDHDRGAKWVAYRDLESLRPYLLVAQDARRVEVYSREAKRWSLQVLYAAAGEARERSGDAHLVFERSAYTAAARHPLAALGMAVVAAGALAFAGGLMRRRTRAR